MKNVLVLVHDDKGQESRLQAALDLTRALSGHLSCLDVVVPPAAMRDRFEGPGGAITMDDVRERESANRRAIERRLQREDVPWTMLERTGDPVRVLRELSDLADITVASIPDDHTAGEFRNVIGELAVKTHRPVLAVPVTCRGLDVHGKALIGWNGSPEALEALRQTLPVLQSATSATLLAVDHPQGDTSPEDAAMYLSRHGIAAEIVSRESAGSPISTVILEEADVIGASYG